LLRREVVEDELDIVPRAKLKAALRDVEKDPGGGKALGGALQGCRSIRVGGSENRIVYRELNDENNNVEVLAIGRRRDDEVYDTAGKRL
jgi:mRNA-degrading endonuclease RelE of RelBE toxin-antitoxin system